MSRPLIATIVSAIFLVPVAHAQQAPAPAPSAKTPAPVTLTGCVSAKPGTSGQYTFADANGVAEYRLNGKGIKKFAGQRVELVGGASGTGLTIRGGLSPAASGGARGVALDPAQESLKRQPGGGGAGTGGDFPEFRVSRLRPAAGVCEQAR